MNFGTYRCELLKQFTDAHTVLQRHLAAVLNHHAIRHRVGNGTPISTKSTPLACKHFRIGKVSSSFGKPAVKYTERIFSDFCWNNLLILFIKKPLPNLPRREEIKLVLLFINC